MTSHEMTLHAETAIGLASELTGMPNRHIPIRAQRPPAWFCTSLFSTPSSLKQGAKFRISKCEGLMGAELVVVECDGVGFPPPDA